MGRPDGLSRRRFLASLAAGAASLGPLGRIAAAREPEPVAFFFISDTHYRASRDDPSRLDPLSAEVTARLVDVLNRLPGSAIPDAAGGGSVLPPRGVVHGGDIIDTGDKGDGAGPRRLQETEWRAYAADMGVSGGDGKVRFPVHEVHGNHDSPPGKGIAVDGIIERNRSRQGLARISPNGLHAAWDWGPVRLVTAGIVAAPGEGVTERRKYDPRSSLEFLAAEVAAGAGRPGRPLIIVHHVDVLRYSGDPSAPAKGAEWDPADVRLFREAVRGLEAAAIFHGHTHGRRIFRWNGTAAPASEGIPVFNVASAAHPEGRNHSFFYVEVGADSLRVREYGSRDRWKTGAWAPESWTVPLAAGGRKSRRV